MGLIDKNKQMLNIEATPVTQKQKKTVESFSIKSPQQSGFYSMNTENKQFPRDIVVYGHEVDVVIPSTHNSNLQTNQGMKEYDYTMQSWSEDVTDQNTTKPKRFIS